MPTVPLYDTLLSRMTTAPSVELKAMTCCKLNKLEETPAKHITIMLIHYLCKYFGSINFRSKLPFGIKVGASGKGLSFNFDLLPIELQRVFCEYCK